jgi:uncharacterized phage protein gp47/JayE
MAVAVAPTEAIYNETDETVRARLLADMPEDLSQVEGSWTRDFLEVAVLEFTRLWDELNRFVAMTFPSTAYGELLDRHAESYGLTRFEGARAVGTVHFTGDVSAFIPANTFVAAPTVDPTTDRAIYGTTVAATIPATGYVDVPVQATDIGEHANQGPGAVTLLETPTPGVDEVTNPGPMTQGREIETDFDFRERILSAAALPTGSGNVADYVAWGLEVPGVSEVAVEPLWDRAGGANGAGTVLVSVRGPEHAPVDWGTLQAVQKHIDPTRQMIAQTDGRVGTAAWSMSGFGTLSLDATEKQTGASSLLLDQLGGAGTTVLHFAQTMDLSRFVDEDYVYLWAKASDWSRVSGASYVELGSDDANYYRAPLSAFAPAEGSSKPTSGSQWWEWVVPRSVFSGMGAPAWSNITRVRIGVVATDAVTTNWDYISIRSVKGATGRGRAPVGAAVTVVTPIARPIAVIAKLVLADGFTLTGAPGTADASVILTDNLRTMLARTTPGDPVRVSEIANTIHDTPGIVDFTLTVPGATGIPPKIDVTLGEYAVLGTLSLSGWDYASMTLTEGTYAQLQNTFATYDDLRDNTRKT